MRRSLPGINVQPRFAGHRTRPSKLLSTDIFIYGVLFIAWVAVSWPAFRQIWWHADDFTRATYFDPWFSVGQGRPLEIIVPYLMHLESAQQILWVHQAIRLLQASFHVLTALFLIRLYRELVGYEIACSAVIFFLFWPFHAESVLWISALAYPLAAALSLGGLQLIRRTKRYERWFGALMVAGAMWTNQAAAVAALVAWVIYHGLFVIQQKRLKDGWVTEALLLAVGYIGGGIVSRVLIFWVLQDPGRSALTGNLGEKIRFWLELNRQYFASPNYPPALTLLLMSLPLLLGVLLLRQLLVRQLQLLQVVVIMLLLSLLTIMPYGVVLLTQESSPAWRILYLAPLFSVAVWMIGQSLLPHYRWRRFLSGGLLALFLGLSIPINRENAVDYVNVFNQDMAQLGRIEETAASHTPPLNQVIVATYPAYLRTWDLYDVTYMHYDSKKSAFLRDWTVIPLIDDHSELASTPAPGYRFTQDPPQLQACVALCVADQQQQPWQLLVMPDEQTLCVCP